MLRYIERNPVRAGLVERAQDWPWSSAAPPRGGEPPLDQGPVSRPAGWLEHGNAPQTDAEVDALRECIRRRRPYGNEAWGQRAARCLGLEASLRPRGRPPKQGVNPPSLLDNGTDQE